MEKDKKDSHKLTEQFMYLPKTPPPSNFDIITQGRSQEQIIAMTKFQLENFNAALNVIRVRIEFGYNDLEENKNIYHCLPNVFLAWIVNQEEIIQKKETKKESLSISEL